MTQVGITMALLGLSACAMSRPFAPVGQEARGRGTYRAAVYDIRSDAGDWGEVNVRVWNSPLNRSASALRIPLSLSVSNNGDRSVRLDMARTALELRLSKGPGQELKPVDVGTSTVIEAGAERTYPLVFEAPPGLKTEALDGYALRWTLVQGARGFSRTTVFARDDEADGVYSWAPFDPFFPYAPFYGGPYGALDSDARGTRGQIGVGIGVGLGH